MNILKRVAFACALLLAIPALAQTNVSGKSVTDGKSTGNPLPSGEWCFGSNCLAIANGSFSGSVTPGTTTVTILNSSSNIILTVPSVTVGSTALNWDTYAMPANVVATGTGAPRMSCIAGATYIQAGASTTWTCMAISSFDIWVQSGSANPPAQPAASSGVYGGSGAPTFACIAPCLYIQSNPSSAAQALYALIAPVGGQSTNWQLQAGGISGGGLTFSGAYSASTTYGIGAVVTSGSSSYVSLQAGNLAQAPASSPTYWSAFAAAPGSTAALTWMGAWSSSTAYVINDAVSYNGSSYVAIAAGTDELPTNTTYWTLIAAQGATGPQGTTGATGATGSTGPMGPSGGSTSWMGAWSSSTTYVLDEAVSYLGSSYIALATNTGVTPGTNSADWQLLAQAGATGATGAAGSGMADPGTNGFVYRTALNVTAPATYQQLETLQASDTVNNSAVGYHAGSGGDSTVPAPAAGVWYTAYKGSILQSSHNGDAYVPANPLSCQPGVGDGLDLITAGTYLTTTCRNETGHTWTITSIKCVSDGTASTCSAMNSEGTELLTGDITGTATYATGMQSSTVTVASGDYLKISFVADGTSHQIGIDVSGWY